MSTFAEPSNPRLRLSAVTLEDLDEFYALHSDPRLYQHEPEAMHPDRAHSESVIGCYVEDWARWKLGYWSVRSAATGEYLGCAGLRRNEVNWNIYYRFHRSAWGFGYAAESIRVAAQCAEAIEPEAVLQAEMHSDNTPSRHVAEELGLTFCGPGQSLTGAPVVIYQLPAAEASVYARTSR
jgi:RimJ/RimL family protein N-acetyltransferase